jgi:hypothetical protein
MTDPVTDRPKEHAMTIFELNELIGRCQSGGRPSS